MANRIYISILNTKINFSSICTEDISVQAQSQFTRIGDFIPGISSLASMLSSGQNAMWGGISEAMNKVTTALDVPLWQKTEPVKISTDLNFFIKTSGYFDVWRPTMILQSMNILSKDANKRVLITPGLNISSISEMVMSEDVHTNKANISTASGANTLQQTLFNAQAADMQEAIAAQGGDIPSYASFSTTQSKLCSVYIPSIVYLPVAIVEVAQPTWSKQLSYDQSTGEKYPIWSKVNVQFTGLYPAVYEDNFGAICPKSIGSINL